MKTLKTVVTNATKRVVKYVDDILWTKYKNKLLADVSPEKRPLYDRLLDNLRHYLSQDSFGTFVLTATSWFSKFRKKPTKQLSDEVMYNITKRVLDKLEILNLVGVQPMQAPVGLTYAMQYDTVEEDGEHQMRLQIVSKAVQAQTRRLSARLSLEVASDLKMMHDIDLVEEMSNILAMEIGTEINTAILDNLCDIAVPVTFDASTSMDTIADVKRFVLAVGKESNRLALDTRRGPANWVVVDAQTCSMLLTCARELSPSWVSFIDKPKFQIGSLLHVGYIHGTIKLYVSQSFENKALIGYKGAAEVDTGFIFSPYILCSTTGIMIDPETFQPMIGLGTRYGVTINDGNLARGGQYYRQLTFEGSTDG